MASSTNVDLSDYEVYGKLIQSTLVELENLKDEPENGEDFQFLAYDIADTLADMSPKRQPEKLFESLPDLSKCGLNLVEEVRKGLDQYSLDEGFDTSIAENWKWAGDSK